MTIPFTKMHGLGNDFMVVNALKQKFNLADLPIPTLSDRHLGIGFDQLLLIERSNHADFFCRIFNADGSEAEQCGNGLRCVARFIHEENLHPSRHFSIATKAGVFPIHIPDNDHIRVTLGAPEIQEKLVELSVPDHPEKIAASILTLGNPHAVIKVTELDAVPIKKWGAAISAHNYFPAEPMWDLCKSSTHHIFVYARMSAAVGKHALAAAMPALQLWQEFLING